MLALPFAAPARPVLDLDFSRLRHRDLGRGAWLSHQPRWLHGGEPLMDELIARVAWERQERPMYERVVEVPRLLGRPPDPLPPLLGQMRDALSARYGVALDRLSLAWYRDGRDSVAWHGDRLGEHKGHAVVAVCSLGASRRFLVRPAGGGRSLRLDVGHGDLVVMGGTIHETFEHCVPKLPEAPDPELGTGARLALMFRHAAPWGGAGAPPPGAATLLLRPLR